MSHTIRRYRLFRAAGFTRMYAAMRALYFHPATVRRVLGIVALCAIIAGCDAPTRPTSTPTPAATVAPIVVDTHAPVVCVVPPSHTHGMPVSMPDGSISYVCDTQPREYIVDNRVSIDIDHYVSTDACPVTPID